jgi:hypothetical protein
MPKPVCEEGDVIVLWNQAVHTDREVTANRPDIIIKNKKRENMHTDRCGNTGRQKCCAKGSGKEVKYNSLCKEIRRTWNLKCTIIPVITGATGIVTRSLRKIWKLYQETFDRFTTKDSYTWNITHNTESTAV